ncbi:MAG: AMP-binding protein, partial [Cyanobacteria bacterium P01_A01_bin.135]
GTAFAGGLSLVLSPRWSLTQLRQVLTAHHSDLLLGEAGLIDALRDSMGPGTRALALPMLPGWRLPSDAPTAAVTATHDSGRPFYACFTSGTTGQPKGVVKTHRSWVAGLAASRIEFGITASDQVLVPGSLSHSLSLYAAVEVLAAGATLHLLNRATGAAAVARLQQYPVTVIVAVPTLLHQLTLDAPDPFPGVRLVIAGGAKLTEKVTHRLRQIFPKAQIVEYYGASELGFVSVRWEGMPASSVGRAFEGVALSVRRQDGSAAAVGETGWVCIRSELMCAGYLDQPQNQNQRQGFRYLNGWGTVGDRGWLDAQGYLYLAGRQEMLVCAGVNVYPAEVEAALLKLPEVAAALVLGVSDDCRGDVIHAVVVWQGNPVDRRTLRQRLRPHLPRYACPRRVYALEALPLTPSGKVARAEVAAQLQRGLLAQWEVR